MYFNKYKLDTNLSKYEIVERLNKITNTGNIPLFKINFTEKVFHGKINGETFSVSQAIKGRNSFIPIINGEIISGDKNEIILKMRLQYISILIIILFTTLITWSLLKDFYFGSLFFLLFIYGMTIYFYLNECRNVKKIFDENFR